MICYHEKEQSIEAESKKTQMLELAPQVLKTAIINMFKDAQEKMNILSKQMRSICKERNKIDILEIKIKYLLSHIYIWSPNRREDRRGRTLTRM